MKSEIFSREFTVPPSAIDELNHVNNIVYLQWCLDAAEKHWLRNTTKEIREKYVWVVMNHQIEYRNPAFEGDHLKIETWINTHRGVRSERMYRIIRLSDEKTIVEAKTLWCFLDEKTRKPTLIPDEIAALF